MSSQQTALVLKRYLLLFMYFLVADRCVMVFVSTGAELKDVLPTGKSLD